MLFFKNRVQLMVKSSLLKKEKETNKDEAKNKTDNG